MLEEAIEDTVMTAGSEAYHAAFAFYHNIQAAAKDDVPGAKAIFADLKTRFPGGKRGGTTETVTVKKQVKVDQWSGHKKLYSTHETHSF
jgi:hypothetical protein